MSQPLTTPPPAPLAEAGPASPSGGTATRPSGRVGLVRLLVTNRKATAGLIILTIFILLALGCDPSCSPATRR